MTNAMLWTLIAVAIALAVTLVLIVRFPRKILRRTMICPEQSILAQVSFLRREVGFGNLAVVDVAGCSLLPDGPVTCSKQCMR